MTKKDVKQKEDTPKKKKKKKKSNYYFTIDTQNKIVEYQKLKNKRRQDSIYTEHIQPAFTELVHNLVSVYKFKSSIEDINHLKHDCVVFLFETIYKWKPENGTKAFSYFNVVAKNWLIVNCRQHNKNAMIANTSKEFARSILDLLSDPNKASRIAQNGFTHASKNFDTKLVFSDLIAFIKNFG